MEWVDGQGGRHAVTIPYAAELLKQLFDEWPDGVNEIEAALRWRDREIARLTSESVAVSGEVSDAEVEKLIDEWAEAAGVHFVYMSEHRATMARVLRNDVQQLARAVLALAGSAKQASALERMARLDDEMGIEP